MIKKTLEQKPLRMTEEDIRTLSEKVKPYLTEKRYAHTKAVAEEAAHLGEIFGFSDNDIRRLRVSAWMHDITKKADYKKQLQYCEEFGIITASEREVSANILHGITGAALAKRDFAKYTDADIISGIRWHTTGRADMTVFEALIYLADYIEPTRTFDDCKAVRQYFYDRIDCCGERDEKRLYEVLCDTMIYSFDLTIGNLLEARDIIDGDTVCARNRFIALASNF